MKNRRIVFGIIALFVCMIMAFTLVSCMDAENYHTKDDIFSLIEELEATITEKIEANKTNISVLKTEYTVKTAELEKTIAENKTLIANLTLTYTTKISEVEAKTLANTDALASLKTMYEANLAVLQKADADNTAAIEALTSEYEKKVEALTAADKKNADDLAALSTKYEADLAVLQKADDDNKAAIEALTSDYNKKVAALELEDAANAKAIADLTKDYNTQVDKLESAIKQANDTIASYKIALEESIADLETKQEAQIAEIETLIATVQSANTSQEQKIALLANQIIELQKSMQIERVEFDANGNLVLHFVGGTSQTVNAPEKHVHTFGEWILFQKSAQSCEYLIYYRVCESCGALEWEQQSTELIEHSFGAGEVTREATCSKKGEMTYTCENCGYEIVEDIAVVPHTYDQNAFESDGTTHWNVCAECGAKDEDSVAACEYGTPVVVNPEAGFCKPGSSTATCTVCGNAKVTVIPSSEQHKLTNATYDASNDVVSYTCSVCEAIYQVSGVGTVYDCETSATEIESYTAVSYWSTTVEEDENGNSYVSATVGALPPDDLWEAYHLRGPLKGLNALTFFIIDFDVMADPEMGMCGPTALVCKGTDGWFVNCTLLSIEQDGSITGGNAYTEALAPAGTVNSDEWTHVTIECDLVSGDVSFYVNGTLAATATETALMKDRSLTYINVIIPMASDESQIGCGICLDNMALATGEGAGVSLQIGN